MITFINVILVILLSLIMPYLLGELVCVVCRDKRGMFSKDIAYGFMLMCALFLILALPMILMRIPFHVLVYAWTAVTGILSVVSLFLMVRNKDYKVVTDGFKELWTDISCDRFTACICALALLVIVFETGLLTCKMHVDTDDARFVADAMEALENDTMLLHHPITGQYFGVATGEQRKDITAPYPVYIGLFARLSGIHPAICAHTVFPLLFIPLSYMVFWLISGWIFAGNVKLRGLFVFFLSVLHLFSFETTFSAGYTLLTIIWQGRSAAAMIMLPLLWYILLRITDRDRIRTGDYVLMLLATLANAMLSNMTALFSLLMCVAYMTFITIKKRSFRIMLYSVLSLLPVIAVIVVERILLNTDILYRGPGIVRVI